MADPRFAGLRIWDGSRLESARLPDLVDEPPEVLLALAEQLARQEPLRVIHTETPRELLSLQWFLDLQLVRHARQGHWMPRLLEFDRHAGERLLSLGAGLGSDLVEYARHDAEVVAVCHSATQLALIRRNFELRGLRGLRGLFLHTSLTALPLESSSIDVVSLTGLLQETGEPARLIEEIYRVLKPGGKLLAVLPAHYNIDFWSRYLAFGEARPAHPASEANPLLHATRRFRAADLRQLFSRFTEPRLYQRHLRRSEVPHLYRWLPLALLERLAGRLLVFKAFKPVSSAISEQAAA